jgi:hypothetical protein
VIDVQESRDLRPYARQQTVGTFVGQRERGLMFKTTEKRRAHLPTGFCVDRQNDSDSGLGVDSDHHHLLANRLPADHPVSRDERGAKQRARYLGDENGELFHTRQLRHRGSSEFDEGPR